MEQPLKKPRSPLFGSGPTKKYPGWRLNDLPQDLLSRSHRSPAGVAQLTHLIELTRDILNIPKDYQIAILPGSATGAMECALWSFLGQRPVDVFAWDVFGKLWVTDVVEQLALERRHIYTADFGSLPDLNQYNPDHDVIFTYNGTSAGVQVPDLNWIPDHREGLTICDATSAAFVMDLDWTKLDVTCFSWQKGLGGEAAHGMMVLSPKAVQHLLTYAPSWPIPRLFRLTWNQKIIDGIFIGKTINTPSMLCAADCLSALEWARDLGGIKALAARSEQNFATVNAWLKDHPHFVNLAEKVETQSTSSVCFKFKKETFRDQSSCEIIGKIASYLAENQIAYDTKNHYLAPPSFRLWCGPTMESQDLAHLLPWIDWCCDQLS
jgi:phosphoserine aminotransferase